MDYEKKYKKLHKFISDLYPQMSDYCKEKIDGFLPEIKENNDEKIRKALLEHIKGIKYFLGISKEQMIAWLKKQEEKKFVNINDIKEKAHKIAWETSKHYDPNICKQQWCEMAALDMALWLEKGITTK